MYSCITHGWTSHAGICPACQQFQMSSGSDLSVVEGCRLSNDAAPSGFVPAPQRSTIEGLESRIEALVAETRHLRWGLNSVKRCKRVSKVALAAVKVALDKADNIKFK